MAKRKMTEAQRTAAAANLAKARAAKKPATYKSIAANVQALDEDHGLSMVNVKRYIKATTAVSYTHLTLPTTLQV